LLKISRNVIARSVFLRRGNLDVIDILMTEISEFIPSVTNGIAAPPSVARNESEGPARKDG
jgi:hypothetical protein